jgi:hypothetical protein
LVAGPRWVRDTKTDRLTVRRNLTSTSTFICNAQQQNKTADQPPYMETTPQDPSYCFSRMRRDKLSSRNLHGPGTSGQRKTLECQSWPHCRGCHYCNWGTSLKKDPLFVPRVWSTQLVCVTVVSHTVGHPALSIQQLQQRFASDKI